MSKTKLFTGVLLVLAVLFAQVGTAFAAPGAEDTTTTLTGTVTEIKTETDTNDVTTVLVTLVEGTQTHTVRLSVAYAEFLGLVTVSTDSTGAQVVTPVDPTGMLVTIDTTKIIPDVEEDVHPIAAILASFFGMDAGEVNEMHEDGFGFGVIAQALWMAKNLDGEDITADMILQAKRDNDFSGFTLPDGTTPTNWGQFKKAVLGKKNNLGVIVSGHADSDTTDDNLIKQNNGYGRDNNPGKGKGKNKNP